MAAAGVSCIKIEGRIKGEYYVAAAVNAYRRALDLIERGQYDRAAADTLYRETLKADNRGFTTGFYLDGKESDQDRDNGAESRQNRGNGTDTKRNRDNGAESRQNYNGGKEEGEAVYAARVLGGDCGRGVPIEQRNRFRRGDILEVLSPTDTFNARITIGDNLRDESGTPITDALLVKQRLFLKTELPLKENDLLRRVDRLL
jgi:putative protease